MNRKLFQNKGIFFILLAAMAAVILLMVSLLISDATASNDGLESNSLRSQEQGLKLLSQSGSLDGCMVGRYNALISDNKASLNCTANDVQLADYALISGPTSCIEGEDITVTLLGRFIATADQRWDVGVFVATDGGNANSLGGACYNDYLHPVSADNTDLNLISGFGPFYNGEITEDPADTCGDIEQNQNTFFQTAQITIKCQDSDNDGTADVSSCTVWSNSRSNPENKPSCTSELDTTAETSAKCTCDNVEISGLSVPFDGTIEVIKDVEPDEAPGLFNLQIDEETIFVDAGDGDSTGPVTVSAGLSTDLAPIGITHSVGEIPGTGTDLELYSTEIDCEDQEGDSANGTGAGPLDIFVEPGDAWVCTITNSYLVEPTTTDTPVPTDTPTPTDTATPVATEPIVTITPTDTQVPTATEPGVTETPPPTATEPAPTNTPLATLPQPTVPPGTPTPQILIPETGVDLSASGPGSGSIYWLVIFYTLGLLGVGMIFYGIATYYMRHKAR